MRDKRKESQVEMKMKVKNFSYMFQIQFGSLIFQRNYRKHYSYSFHRINNWSNYLYLEIDFRILQHLNFITPHLTLPIDFTH